MTVKGIEVSGTIYDNEDETARNAATEATQTATQASQTATEAGQTAEEANQTATQASQSVENLRSTVAEHEQQLNSLDISKASRTVLNLKANSDLTAESFTQMVYQKLNDIPATSIVEIILNLDGHTFTPTEGSDLNGDYIIFAAAGMQNVFDLPDPIFWGGTYGTYILFQPNATHPTFGNFAFMWGNAFDTGDLSLSTVYFN